MMKCIAIDDEPIALSVITQFCSRMEGIELIGTFTDPHKGLAEVMKQRPDILFLDIEMGSVSGVELARDVPPSVHIIFTTAYAQFAIDGFDLGVIDFLHKPFSFPRFEKAVERSRRMRIMMKPESENSTTGMISVSVEYRNITIDPAYIIFIEAMDNYIRIHLINSRPLLPQMSLKAFEELLPSDGFVRIHKSYIVSRRAIAEYNRTQITLRDNTTQLPIGRSYAEAFQKWIVK